MATRSAFAPLSALFATIALGAAQAAPGTIELPGARVFPESTTATADGTVYVGSLAMGGIMRAPKTRRKSNRS